METFIAIILVIIMIMYDSNIIKKKFSKELFHVPSPRILNTVTENILPKQNPLILRKVNVWIFTGAESQAHYGSNTHNNNKYITDLERLCIATVIKHMSDYNVRVISYTNISSLLPEYYEYINKCSSNYVLKNLVKYAILNKFGGIWIPSDYIMMNSLNGVTNLLRDKFITFSINGVYDCDNTDVSDDIVGCNKKHLLTIDMLNYLKSLLNTFQHSINFTKEINNKFNKILKTHSRHHTNQIQTHIGNLLINDRHLFSNQIAISAVDNVFIKTEIENIKNIPKYSFILNMTKGDILNSNMLIGRLINHSLYQ